MPDAITNKQALFGQTQSTILSLHETLLNKHLNFFPGQLHWGHAGFLLKPFLGNTIESTQSEY